MATREEPGSSCGKSRRTNPVDQLEKAFMDCFASLTKKTPLIGSDRSQVRNDVHEEIPKFLNQARVLEGFFIRKRIDVARVRPDLVLRDETMELKSELQRKENLLRINQEKIRNWQYEFGKVSSDSSSESEKGLPSTSTSNEPNQQPPSDLGTFEVERRMNSIPEQPPCSSPAPPPLTQPSTSTEIERGGWGTVSPYALNVPSSSVDQVSGGSVEEYCQPGPLAHSSPQHTSQREYWQSSAQWNPPHPLHQSVHGYCEGPCCIPPFTHIHAEQMPPMSPSLLPPPFHMNPMDSYQFISYGHPAGVPHPQRRRSNVPPQLMEAHNSLPPFNVIYPGQGFSGMNSESLGMDPYLQLSVDGNLIGRGSGGRGRARVRRGRGSRGPRGRPRIEETDLRAQMSSMRDPERGSARPRARGLGRIRRPRGPRGPRVVQGPPPALNDNQPKLEGYEFERFSIISGGGGGEVAEILQQSTQQPLFDIPPLEQNVLSYGRIQSIEEEVEFGRMEGEEESTSRQKAMAKQALDYSMKRND